MLAFELPPDNIVAVEFLGLSQQAEPGELQKDLLRQVLGEIIPGGREFVDVVEAPTSAQKSGIVLRCIKCDIQPGKSPTFARVIGEESAPKFDKKATQRFKIAISSSIHDQQTWTIEVGSRNISWYATINNEVLGKTYRLEKKHFEIKSCVEGINCPTTSIFGSNTDAARWAEQFSGKRVDSESASALLRKEKHLFPEKVQYLLDVRSQSIVRAMMSSSNSSLTIKTQGKALKGGSLGEVLPIEINTSTFGVSKKRLINARVIGEGEVELVH